MRALLIVLLLATVSCTDDGPVPSPRSTPAPDVEPGRGASVRIVSVVGHPNGSGNQWQLPADQDRLELEITLEGKGRFEVKAELESLDGDDRRELERTIDLDGEERIDLGDFLVPIPGSYRLTVEVVGEGLRSRQQVSVRRG